MSGRRLASVLFCAGLVTSMSALAGAQPKPGPAKPTPPTPTTTPADTTTAPADGSGQPVEMTEDAPADMEGTSEDPDAPKVAGEQEETKAPPKASRSGYPIELALRPITLLQNMSEISIDPHLEVSPLQFTTALRARYGITRQVQIGLTYVLAAAYDDPDTLASDKVGFHPGRAVGLDVTVLIRDWIGVRVGVPVYINPVATSLAIGVPLQFTFGNKVLIGGLDDLLNIRLTKFAPTFYNEAQNAANAEAFATNTVTRRGDLKFSAFGVYNQKPNLAFILRASLTLENFDTGRSDGGKGLVTAIRAGLTFSPKRFLDLGFSLGFDDMARSGTFGPGGYLAFRI